MLQVVFRVQATSEYTPNIKIAFQFRQFNIVSIDTFRVCLILACRAEIQSEV